jgi:hypothetical protein
MRSSDSSCQSCSSHGAHGCIGDSSSIDQQHHVALSIERKHAKESPRLISQKAFASSFAVCGLGAQHLSRLYKEPRKMKKNGSPVVFCYPFPMFSSGFNSMVAVNAFVKDNQRHLEEIPRARHKPVSRDSTSCQCG